MTFLFAFLPVVVLVYMLSPKQMKNAILLIASLFFYAWGEPRNILLMLLSIGINYVFGRIIEADRASQSKMRVWNLGFAVLWNVLILGIFKYVSGISQTLHIMLHTHLDCALTNCENDPGCDLHPGPLVYLRLCERQLRACTDDGAHALHIGEVACLHGIGDGRCAVREHDGVIVERDGVIARCADAVGRGCAREQDGLHAEPAQDEVEPCVEKR